MTHLMTGADGADPGFSFRGAQKSMFARAHHERRRALKAGVQLSGILMLSGAI